MKRRLQQGYTLIEIIVAFAILALGLTLLLGTLSGATRQLRQAGDAGRAALHAQSLLDELGERPQAGSSQGEREGGRYRWQLEVAPWQDPAPRAEGGPVRIDPNAPRLLRLQLRIEWGEGGPGRILQLSSLRLVQPRPEGMAAP